MTIRFFIALLIFVFTLPVYAKDMQVEQIKQTIFKNAKTQISPSNFPQYDNNRIENLHALNSWQIVDDRTIVKYDSNRYIVKFNSEERYKTCYVYNNDGTLVYVDFIVYPSCIKSFADLSEREMNSESIYPYYVYRYDSRGFLNGIWYIKQYSAYFFSKDRNLIYKCDDFSCADLRTKQNIGPRYYQ